MFRVEETAEGFFVLDAHGRRVTRLFTHRGEANDWIVQHGSEVDRKEREHKAEALEKARAELLPMIKAKIKAAIKNPSLLPSRPRRGRPTAENSHEDLVAYEYYWRVRHGARAAPVIAKLAKKYGCTPDHVRKIRKAYEPLRHYDKDSLRQLRAQAIERHRRTPKPVAASKMSRLEHAKHWLGAVLGSGQLLENEIKRRALHAKLKFRTIERAKASLGVQSLRVGRVWAWKLPQDRQKP